MFPLSKEGGCEDGWKRMNNMCYGAFGSSEPESKTWIDAEKACNDMGGNLASVYAQNIQCEYINKLP